MKKNCAVDPPADELMLAELIAACEERGSTNGTRNKEV